MTHYSDTSREIAPSLCRISMTMSSKSSRVRKPTSKAPAGPVHFDYEGDWHLVVPRLSDPGLQRSLDVLLDDYVKQHVPWRTYVPGSPPWIWTNVNYHYWKATERAEQAGLMTELHREFGFSCSDAFSDAIKDDEDLNQRVGDRFAEIEAPFLPQPDEVSYFQVFGACHWMVPFFGQLARRVVPDLIWTPLFGRYHSTVVGRRTTRGVGSRRVVMVFDPLRSFQSAAETVRDARLR